MRVTITSYHFFFKSLQLDTTKSNLTKDIETAETAVKSSLSTAEEEVKEKVDSNVGEAETNILDRLKAAQDYIAGHFFDGDLQESSGNSQQTTNEGGDQTTVTTSTTSGTTTGTTGTTTTTGATELGKNVINAMLIIYSPVQKVCHIGTTSVRYVVSTRCQVVHMLPYLLNMSPSSI